MSAADDFLPRHMCSEAQLKERDAVWDRIIDGMIAQNKRTEQLAVDRPSENF